MKNPLVVTVELIDTGIQFNPLEKEDPDISWELMKKPGGLGILLIKQNADQVHYQYIDGRNIFNHTEETGLRFTTRLRIKTR